MKKFRYMLLCGLFTLFIPRVYALTYDISTASDILVKSGSKVEIGVGIDNIKDTEDGISVCSMNILFDKNIELESSIRTLNSWTMTTGSSYLFDTGSPVLSKSDIFVIPVVVNGEGSIQLSNIVCSDGLAEVSVNNKIINFSIEKEENKNEGNSDNTQKPNDSSQDNTSTDNETNGNQSGDDSKEDVKSNCNLSDIELSEGTIEFDPNVTEYEVKITNFDNFRVTPKLEDPNAASYVIDRNLTTDGGNVIITVNGSNGDMKVYTIYTIVDNSDVEDEPKKMNYIPIFIGVIVLLVVINLLRIIKNAKKK